MNEATSAPANLERRGESIQIAGLGAILSTGLVLAWTSLKLPIVCPFRALTGIPCPLCGMTTGTVAFLRGNLTESLRVAPLSVLVVPGLIGGLILRLKSLMSPPRQNVGKRGRKRGFVLSLALAGLFAWIFQLFRFGVI